MNQLTEGSNTSISSSVTENLSVQEETQGHEKRTTLIIAIILIALIIAGMARFWLIGNSEPEYVQPTTTQPTPTQVPTATQPKDDGSTKF